MKKILLLIMVTCALQARIDKLSNIEPAQVIYINLSTTPCDQACLENLLKEKLYMSFLSQYSSNYANDSLAEIFDTISSNRIVYNNDSSNTSQINTTAINLAIIIPQKVIKGYTQVVTNAIFAYTIQKRLNVNLKFFLTDDESQANMEKALKNIKNLGFKYVIAAVTNDGLNFLKNDEYSNMIFYIPTLNKNITNIKNSNIIFGGIDYEKQITSLIKYANNALFVFSDDSYLANIINKYILNQNSSATIRMINNNNFNVTNLIDKNLDGASIFLNTPLIKTALLSSQIRVYDIEPSAILSTQINYNNALFSLTQPEDRKNMYIANSIGQIDNQIIANNAFLGQDINFNWIAYSTTFGFDFLYTNFIDKTQKPQFNEIVQDNQVMYQTKIIRLNRYGFYE